jgi:hypothetical protein
MDTEEINAFNNLPEKEKKKYIGVGFNTIINNHIRKKMCINYKNVINPCKSKIIYEGKYYSNAAKMIAWKQFAINRNKSIYEALFYARQKALCIECVKHYSNINEYINIDLRNKLCVLCKKHKSINLCCTKCEQLIINNSKEEVLEVLLNPLKFMFPDIDLNRHRHINTDIDFYSTNIIKKLIIYRQYIIKFYLTNKYENINLNIFPKSNISEWYYCLEPTENDTSDRLINNKYNNI